LLIIVSYLPWIILNSWKSKTFANCFVRLVLLDSQSQFLTSCSALARAQLATLWSFRLCTTIAFPKMRLFILAWSWCQGPPVKVEGLSGLDFSATKLCTSFKCLVNNHLAQYATVQVPILHFHFDPTFVHSLSFRAKLGGQKSASGWEAYSVSCSEPKPKNESSKNRMQVLQNINSLNHILLL
jgi:hypothetical protein